MNTPCQLHGMIWRDSGTYQLLSQIRNENCWNNGTFKGNLREPKENQQAQYYN